MAFKVATMTLKLVNGVPVVSPVKVQWDDVQCFSYSGNVPLQGNGVPLGPGKPFSFGPCKEGGGGLVRTSEMSFAPASIATWESPSFDNGAKVILQMNVDSIGLQNLTVNLKCEVHPVTAVSALAREVLEAGKVALSALGMFAVAVFRLLSELLLLPLYLSGVLTRSEASSAGTFGADDGAGVEPQRPADWSTARPSPGAPS